MRLENIVAIQKQTARNVIKVFWRLLYNNTTAESIMNIEPTIHN